MPDICQASPDIQIINTTCIKQNLQGGIWPKKFQLDQIRNGPLSAIIINFNTCMPDTRQTVPDR